MTDLINPEHHGEASTLQGSARSGNLAAVALGVAVLALAVAGAGTWVAVVRDGSGTGATSTAAATGDSARNDLFDGPADLPALIDEVGKSVVDIECGDGGGTGFSGDIELTNPSGPGHSVIVTNHHVIEKCIDGALTITVLTGPNRTPAKTVRLIGSDADNDLALIEIDVTVPPLKGATSFASPGWWSMVVGNPYDSAIDEVLYGYVSIGHIGYVLDEQLNYTSATINNGNSGGPLVNARGELIGITTFASASTEEGVWNIAVDSELLCENLLDCSN
jgi:S1-C subfamily serine protease